MNFEEATVLLFMLRNNVEYANRKEGSENVWRSVGGRERVEGVSSSSASSRVCVSNYAILLFSISGISACMSLVNVH